MKYALIEGEGNPAILCVEDKHSVIVEVADLDTSQGFVRWLNDHQTPIQDFRDWALGEDVSGMEELAQPSAES